MRFLIIFLFLSGLTHAGKKSLEKFCYEHRQNTLKSNMANEKNGFYFGYDERGTKIKERYYGCNYSNLWIKDTLDALCEKSEARRTSDIEKRITLVNPPKTIFFFFDGAFDFDALGSMSHMPANISGNEGVDGAGNRNGVKMWFEGIKKNEDLDSDIRNGDLEWHYHTGSPFHNRAKVKDAKACIEQTKNILKTYNKYADDRDQVHPKWVAAGYSNGGMAVIDLAHDVSFDLVVTIDPIERALGFVLNKLTDYIGKKSKKTKRHVNIYQNSDHGSMVALELHGKPVKRADHNIYLDASEQWLNDDGHKNHVRISSHLYTRSVLACEIKNIHFNTDRDCLKEYESLR